MTTEIISVGDELLIGQVVNTNAAFIGELCSSQGLKVQRVSTLGDEKSELIQCFARAWEEHDIVIVTGGLGPTHDDVTRDAVAEFFNSELLFSEPVFDDIQAFFASRQRDISDANRDQALVPHNAGYLRNLHGTAPGMHYERNEKHFFVLPGVPGEMKPMMQNAVIPLLSGLVSNAYASCVIMTTGIPESDLAEKFEGIEKFFGTASLAYLPSALGVRLRLSSIATQMEEAQNSLQQLKDFIYQRVSDYIYAEDERSLEEIVASLLIERSATIAVAESCSSGMLADRLTDVPGSSAYFDRGIVAYSNKSKEEELGVPAELLIEHGAVSREVALAMAEGIRARAGTDFALSTTGIAGPGGASEDKPVGMVWIAFCSNAQSFAIDYYFGNDRKKNKTRTAQTALEMLRRALLGLPALQPSNRTRT
jgi:competence/damage-inducible protein CinA-like protein